MRKVYLNLFLQFSLKLNIKFFISEILESFTITSHSFELFAVLKLFLNELSLLKIVFELSLFLLLLFWLYLLQRLLSIFILDDFTILNQNLALIISLCLSIWLLIQNIEHFFSCLDSVIFLFIALILYNMSCLWSFVTYLITIFWRMLMVF